MKSRTLPWFTAITLFAALAIPAGLAGQDDPAQANKPKHHHYKLVDIELGGSQSAVFEFAHTLTNRGALVGMAETSSPDPNYPNFSPFVGFGNPDPFIQRAFLWQNGVLTDLGAFIDSSQASAVSARGVVVGVSENGLIDPLNGVLAVHAVIWNDGQIIDLGTLEGGYESLANDINDRGEVVGNSQNAIPDPFGYGGVQTRAVLWRNGTMQDLGTLGIGNDAITIRVNDRGQVAGWSFTNSTSNPVTGIPTQDPFVWHDGKMLDLGTLGGTSGVPNALNNGGQVVGVSNVAGDAFGHPFLWTKPGPMQDLGTFGGNIGSAFWINDGGDVVGVASFPGDQIVHAFLWKDGVKTDLGTLDGDSTSDAIGVNSKDQVVGSSVSGNGFVRGFLWENGSMFDLNTLISPGSKLNLYFPSIINDRGEIAGQAQLPNGDIHAFLLIPCDENHPDIEGCEYTLAEGNATADVTQGSNIRSPVTNSPGAAVDQLNRMLGGMLAGSHERLASRFRNALAAVSRAPYDLIASALNTYQIRINWQEASGQNQSGFNIYRCRGCSSPRTEGTKIASVGGTVRTYTDGSSTSPLTETSSYAYQVTAFIGSGESGPSNASSATTKTEPAPTNLTSFAFSRGFDDIVDLHWTNHATDDNSYFLESCSGPTCTNFSVVAQLPANTTSDMQFFQFFPDITFRYRVRAHSPGGFSAYSNIRNQALP